MLLDSNLSCILQDFKYDQKIAYIKGKESHLNKPAWPYNGSQVVKGWTNPYTTFVLSGSKVPEIDIVQNVGMLKYTPFKM